MLDIARLARCVTISALPLLAGGVIFTSIVSTLAPSGIPLRGALFMEAQKENTL
jgi:hypothetical protein